MVFLEEFKMTHLSGDLGSFYLCIESVFMLCDTKSSFYFH